MNTSAFIRKNLRLTVLASVVALAAFGASNSFAAEATTSATGTVITPITIENPVNLVFGRFTAGAGGGTVTVSTNGARTSTGDVILSTVDSPTAAQFNVSGGTNDTYSIAWSKVDLTDGTNSMVLDLISEITPSGSTTVGDVTSGQLSSGTQSFYLGGKLTVATGQAPADYTGSVTATVEYN